MGRRNGITIKERKLVNKYVVTGNATEAAISAYNTADRRIAASIGKEALQRPIVKEYLKQLLDKRGLSLEDITDKMYQSIDHNMKMGKGSQAVAADLMKFTVKLHDAIPASKSLNVSAKVGSTENLSTSPAELLKALKELTDSNMLLVKQFEK